MVDGRVGLLAVLRLRLLTVVLAENRMLQQQSEEGGTLASAPAQIGCGCGDRVTIHADAGYMPARTQWSVDVVVDRWRAQDAGSRARQARVGGGQETRSRKRSLRPPLDVERWWCSGAEVQRRRVESVERKLGAPFRCLTVSCLTLHAQRLQSKTSRAAITDKARGEVVARCVARGRLLQDYERARPLPRQLFITIS